MEFYKYCKHFSITIGLLMLFVAIFISIISIKRNQGLQNEETEKLQEMIIKTGKSIGNLRKVQIEETAKLEEIIFKTINTIEKIQQNQYKPKLSNQEVKTDFSEEKVNLEKLMNEIKNSIKQFKNDQDIYFIDDDKVTLEKMIIEDKNSIEQIIQNQNKSAEEIQMMNYKLRILNNSIQDIDQKRRLFMETGCTIVDSDCFTVQLIMGKNWTDSHKVCKDLGGYLADFTRILDLTKFKSAFPQLEREIKDGKLFTLWLDASDPKGIWRWGRTNQIIDKTDSRWKIGQPDNWNGDEHCLFLRYDGMEAEFLDYKCDTKTGFICQYSV